MEKVIINLLNDLRPEFDFSKGLNFIEEGMLDSFDIISLVVALDEKFNISINGEEILPENFSNVMNIKTLLIRNGASV